MRWTFPWASSFGGDFNFDFSVGFTEEQQREGLVEYNYGRREAPLAREAGGGGLSSSRRAREPTWPRTCARGQA